MTHPAALPHVLGSWRRTLPFHAADGFWCRTSVVRTPWKDSCLRPHIQSTSSLSTSSESANRLPSSLSILCAQVTWHILVLSHTRTVVRECFKGDEACKSMEKAKIRPLAKPKPLNRSSQELAGVIMSWTTPGTQNFVAIGLRVSSPQIHDFPSLSDD